MNKKGIILLGMMVSMMFPASVLAFCAPPNPPTPPSIPGANNMMAPAAHNAYTEALELKEKAHSLLDQAEEQDLDVSDTANLIEEADALMEKAERIMRVNPIAAMNMIRQAAQIYENAISDLEALLG